MSMLTSACWRTTSTTDWVRQASNAASSYGLPSSINRQNSISLGGLIKLPTWVVRMRSVLCGMLSVPPAGHLVGALCRCDLLALEQRHHLLRKQLHRSLGVGLADHSKVHLKRSGLKTVDLSVVSGDSVADVVWRADPSRAFGDLGLEVLFGDEFDHLLIIRVVFGGDARHPFRGRIDDRFEINIQRLTRDRRRLFAALRAEHVEGQHDAAAAGMAGRAPSLTIDFDQLGHLRAGERDAHEMMPEPTGVLKRLFGRKRGNPKLRPWRLRGPRLRCHIFKAMKVPAARHVLLGKKSPDLLEALVEAGATLVHRNAKPAEFVRQKSADKADFQAALRNRVNHTDLPGKLQRVIENRQDGPGDQAAFCALAQPQRQERSEGPDYSRHRNGNS